MGTLTRTPPARSVAPLLLLCTIASGCGELDAECVANCEALQMCGLLPSPLGVSVENCRERCSNTPNGEVATEVKGCRDDAGAAGITGGEVSSSLSWDAGADAEVEASSCAVLAKCLVTMLPGRAASGTGEVITTVRFCDAGVGEPDAEASPAALCDKQRVSQVALIPPATALAASDASSLSCAEAVTRGFGPIPVQAGSDRVRVKRIVAAETDDGGMPRDGGAGQSDCKIVESKAYSVVADDTSTANVCLDAPALEKQCENGDQCVNGVDDDADGKKDAADPNCAAFFGTCTLRMSDAGQVPDCADPECAIACALIDAGSHAQVHPDASAASDASVASDASPDSDPDLDAGEPDGG
jgi:hypothetical protein